MPTREVTSSGGLPLFSSRLCWMAAFHFSAMRSKASSQDTGSNWPSLSYLPSFLRSSGWVSRSSPYMILDRK